MWRKSASVLLVHQGSYIAGVQPGILRGKPTCYWNDMAKGSYTEWYIMCTGV
jgi:hypothetical protein